jgi:hypothetical protein
VLGSLCDKLRFSPEAALELHKSLYKTKMTQLVSGKEKGGIADVLAVGQVEPVERMFGIGGIMFCSPVTDDIKLTSPHPLH